MPQLILHSTNPNLTQGSPGHAFLEIRNGNQSEVFGFYPSGNPLGGPGQIKDDSAVNPDTSSTPINISEAQAQQIREFRDYVDRLGHYTVEGNTGTPRGYPAGSYNCATFVLEAARRAGITPSESPWLPGLPWPLPTWFNPKNPDYWPDTDALGNPIPPEIGPTVTDQVSNGTAPGRRDPLAIDLDSDGIETRGLPTSGEPIKFDHNADGVKTGTGWLKPDDAWLVLDRNGNGTIDSGRELFGVDTQVTVNGETRPATSGFEALSALDRGTGATGSAGYGDKIFDAKDADFTRVRLWQDLNQDGVSQANELFTLAQKGVTSISLTPTTEATPLGNGNVITGRATVRFTNNTTTQVDSVAVSDRTAGNLELVDNPFYREFTTAIPHTAAAAAMPEMRGSGMVRDMREALSLGNANSTSLASVLQQYTQAKTRDAQIALLDQLIFRWGDTSTMQTSITTDRRPSATGPFTAIEAWGLANLPLFMKINALEQFNGTNILSRFVVASGNAFTVAPLDSWRVEALEAAWTALRESVHGGLVVQTRLKPYLDAITLNLSESGLAFDSSGIVTKLEALRSTNPRSGLIDLVELTRYADTSLRPLGFDSFKLLEDWISPLPANSPLMHLAKDLMVITGDGIATAGRDLVITGIEDNRIESTDGDDLISTGGGQDTVYAGLGKVFKTPAAMATEARYSTW